MYIIRGKLNGRDYECDETFDTYEAAEDYISELENYITVGAEAFR